MRVGDAAVGSWLLAFGKAKPKATWRKRSHNQNPLFTAGDAETRRKVMGKTKSKANQTREQPRTPRHAGVRDKLKNGKTQVSAIYLRLAKRRKARAELKPRRRFCFRWYGKA